MRKLGLILAALLFLCATPAGKITDCMYKYKKLYGRVRIVESHSAPDFRVRIVDNGEDLRVKVRERSTDANKCGEWKFVGYNESADFTVQFVEYSEDFTIKFVDN